MSCFLCISFEVHQIPCYFVSLPEHRTVQYEFRASPGKPILRYLCWRDNVIFYVVFCFAHFQFTASKL
jgi:hypothetical protein